MHFVFISDAVSLHIASLAQGTLSTMVAGDARQTISVQIMHVFIFSCCVILHKLCRWDSNSCKSFTCYYGVY